MTIKSCTDQHYPDGKWVKATLLQNVAGVNHRREDATAFVRKAQQAEKKGRKYGLRLELEPSNPYDKNAIKVLGYAETTSFFGRHEVQVWHIGYIDRDSAREFQSEFIREAIPIDVVLYAVYENPPYLDIGYILLAPSGHSHSARMKRRR